MGEGMEIVVEFKRRMEVCFGEAKALRNRERERVDSPCGDHSSTIAFAQLKTRCAIRGFFLSRKYFLLDVHELVGVHYVTNGLDTLCLHFNGEHSKSSITGARDERRLTIDFCQFHPRALW